MDLVDLIAEKRFVGQEFLTWLWWKSEERGGSIELPGLGDILVVFEKHMLLEYGEGEASEKLICKGLQAELQEARTGLQVGKKLEQARLKIARGDYEWSVTLTGALLEFRSVKLPKTAGTEQGGDNGPEEVEGMILERVFLFEELVKLVEELLRLYMGVRTGGDWQQELVKVRSWVGTNH
ncbi:MAG: hypothetical protein ABFS19_11820 [Thermodesulfobacteriota bacterium]